MTLMSTLLPLRTLNPLPLTVILPLLLIITAGDAPARAGVECFEDTDCPQFSRCAFSDGDVGDVTVITSGEATDTDSDDAPMDAGGPEADSGSDGSPGGAPPMEPIEPNPDEMAPGECAVDVETLPMDPSCESLCNAAALCAEELRLDGSGSGDTPSPSTPSSSDGSSEGSSGASSQPSDSAPPSAGGGSSDPDPDAASEPADADPDDSVPSPAMDDSEGSSADPIAEFITLCSQTCSYGVAANLPGADEVDNARDCIDAQASCSDVETNCAPEFEAMDTLTGGAAAEVNFQGRGLSAAASSDDTGSDGSPQGSSDGGAVEVSGPQSGCAAQGGFQGGLPAALLLVTLLAVIRRFNFARWGF